MQETQETQIPSLGREDPLEEEMATHSSILAWRIPRTEELAGYSPWSRKESDATECICTLLYYLNVLWLLQSYATVDIHTHTHTHTHTPLYRKAFYAQIDMLLYVR